MENRTIKLKPRAVTPALLAGLERRGLLRPFRATRRALGAGRGACEVDEAYSASARYGGHRLICVGKNVSEIRLEAHPESEDFLILNPGRLKFKPLFLVVALRRAPELERLASSGRLSAADFLAMRLRYDDPGVCAFTMVRGTPHCELTADGPGRAPVFFVTEPARLGSSSPRLRGFGLELSAREQGDER